MFKWLLHLDLRVNPSTVKPAQIMLIQPGKLCFHIHIAVQIKITVGGMIILAMKIQKVLISQGRNLIRIPAGLVRVRRIRKQGIQNHPV